MTKSLVTQSSKGFRFVLASQLFVLVLGLLKAFLIPSLLGVSNYGHWQLYVFYITYVGFFGLGFNDGLYLRYGGYDLHQLPLETIRPSIQVYLTFLFIGSVLLAAAFSFDKDPDRRFVMYSATLNIVLMGMLAIFSQLLQATNQLKRFGIFNSVDKIFFLLLLPILLIFRIDSYKVLILTDVFSKLFLILLMLYLHKELVIGKFAGVRISAIETYSSVRAGGQLMLANVSGMLVLGTGRFVIEYFDTLENYAYYAFGVSMTNLALVAITALSIVTYPALKRLPESSYISYYEITNRRLYVFNCAMLLAFFPGVWIIERFLPKYNPVTPYLNVLFAITLVQGKMQLLNNTYYKVLRKEGAMLIANLSSLLIVLTLSAITYALTRSITAIALSALITMLYRVYASELYLRKTMGDQSLGRFHFELLAIGVFLFSTFCLPLAQSFTVYLVFVLVVMFTMRSELLALAELALGRSR